MYAQGSQRLHQVPRSIALHMIPEMGFLTAWGAGLPRPPEGYIKGMCALSGCRNFIFH